MVGLIKTSNAFHFLFVSTKHQIKHQKHIIFYFYKTLNNLSPNYYNKSISWTMINSVSFTIIHVYFLNLLRLWYVTIYTSKKNLSCSQIMDCCKQFVIILYKSKMKQNYIKYIWQNLALNHKPIFNIQFIITKLVF